MALASTEKVVLGTFAFAVFWVLAVFPAVPFLPIGRTAGSLLGAMLMVMFRVISPEQAYSAIDLPILGLLFGTMVVSVYLERADMFKHLGKLLSWKSKGPLDLLWRISLISAISSAFFTNDTSCVVLTEFVLKIAKQRNLPPHPFLLALASSANIGSSATPIGNPQNLVIAIQSKISFGDFVLGVLPAMLVGLVVNVLILTSMYWRSLSSPQQKDEENPIPTKVVADDADDLSSHQFSPPTMFQDCNCTSESVSTISIEGEIRSFSIETSESGNRVSISTESKEATTDVSSQKIQESRVFSAKKVSSILVLGRLREVVSYLQLLAGSRKEGFLTKKWRRLLWKSCVYLVTLGMFVALLMGVNMSWTALTAALVLVVLDFNDAQPCLDKVSYSLLVFFGGMFITVDGFIQTGITNTLWDMMEPHAKIDHAAGIAVLAVVILVMSNFVSNVPTVLLLGGRVAASAAVISAADEKKAWLILAWVSTVAGNLSLLGSAANLIVCEQARRAPNLGFNLSFWTHLKFGVPSTIVVTVVGLALIR